MAHGVFLHRARERNMADRFEVDSSGTTAYHVGEAMDRRAAAELQHHGISFSNNARGFRNRNAGSYDLILAMDRSNYESLRRALPSSLHDRIRLFRSFDPEGSETAEVPDPWYGGRQGFVDVYTMIDRTVEAILDTYTERVS